MKKKVLLVKGGLDGHDRGIQVVARALRDSGLVIIYGGLYCSPEEIAMMAIQEYADVIGISMHSGAHLGVFSDVISILKDKTNKDWFIIGGGIISKKDILILYEMGVKKIFLPSTDTKEIANFVLEAETMGKKKGSPKDLLKRTKEGEISAAASLMTLVERGNKRAKKIVSELPDLPKETLLIGVTGSGGAGKSTLINSIVGFLRKEGKTVGVVCCDPVSVSGGAVLGDRIRMKEHASDSDVFIRSLAQYENFKGVTPDVPYIIKIFGAMKKDAVIVETVGVGQANLGFKDLVRVLIWVCPPGIGDEIQTLKGGAIETADIIVVNQADKPGADSTFQDLLTQFGSTKKIYKTNSLTGEGIQELIQGIKAVQQ